MQKNNFSTSYCKSNWSFNYLEFSINNVQSRADISALVPWRDFFSVIPGVKGIVGASSNVLGRNKPFLKLKYILWELSGHLCFQLHIAVCNLEMDKSDKFLENILTWAVKCIKPYCWYFSPLKFNFISTYPKNYIMPILFVRKKFSTIATKNI